MPAFGAAISEHPVGAQAIGEVIGSVVEQTGTAPDLALLFVRGHDPDAIADMAAAICSLLQPRVLAASTALAVVGGSYEAEQGTAISLWAGRVGEVEAVRLATAESAEGTAVVGMPDSAALGPRTLLLLADPFTFPSDAFLRATNEQYPNLRVLGGVASAPGGPGANRLALGQRMYHDGAVGVLLPAGIGEISVVSQGCRPVGQPLIVTDAAGNRLRTLGSQPATQRLSEVVERSSYRDRELLSSAIHLGVAVDESLAEFKRGDFLIRGMLGVDHTDASLRVGTRLEVGTTVQFHVRDASSATQDLEGTLAEIDADAALLFTGSARGHRLFDEPDHDARRVQQAVGGGPVAGMFCGGEFGPIADKNHVHGSSATALFFYV